MSHDDDDAAKYARPWFMGGSSTGDLNGEEII